MHFTFKLRDQLEGNCPSTYNKGGGGSTTVTESGIPKEFRPYITEGLKTAESMYKDEMSKGGADLKAAYGNLGATGSRLGAEAAAERAGLNQFRTEGAGASAARGFYGNQLSGGDTADEAASKDIYRQQMGQGWNDMISQDLSKTAASGQLGMSSAGALGSARAGMAQQGALADRAMQLRAAENAARGSAAQGLSGLDAASQARQASAAGNLATMDAAQQQRYLSGLEAGQALGEQEYKAAKAGVTATTGAEDAPYRSLDRFFGYLSSPALGSESKQTQSGGGK
jgi:hypothetical protein